MCSRCTSARAHVQLPRLHPEQLAHSLARAFYYSQKQAKYGVSKTTHLSNDGRMTSSPHEPFRHSPTDLSRDLTGKPPSAESTAPKPSTEPQPKPQPKPQLFKLFLKVFGAAINFEMLGYRVELFIKGENIIKLSMVTAVPLNGRRSP